MINNAWTRFLRIASFAERLRDPRRDAMRVDSGRPSHSNVRRPGLLARAYVGSVAGVGAAVVATLVLRGWMGASLSLFFFPAVVLSAIYGGFGPALLATMLSTLCLAFLFIPPRFSLNIGSDDALRLLVFAIVSYATAWVSSARRRAEEAERLALADLQGALDVMRRVSAWPLVADADTSTSMRQILSHGATALGATTAVAVWMAEEEPWVYVTSARPGDDPTSRQPPAHFVQLLNGDRTATAIYEISRAPHVVPEPIRALLPGGLAAEVPFHTEHVAGRVFFGGLGTDADAQALITPAEVIAREIGNSLAHLYVAERSRALAVREDRLRLSRDLHDGVLQALTGIRLELQDIAEDCAAHPGVKDRLLAAERAMALEQRELRRFIDGLKPDTPGAPTGTLRASLEAAAARLTGEWKTPITVRVTPGELALPSALDHEVRLMTHEAIINALKHGHPSRVDVAMLAEDRDLRLTVTDDGRGFRFHGTLDHEALRRENVGPASLRERVSGLGGRLSITSAPTGSRVEIILRR